MTDLARISPVKRKQNMLMASTMSKMVNYRINSRTFDMAVVKLISFECVPLTPKPKTSHRHQDFILFALVATTRLKVLLISRIKCCVSDVSIHIDSTICLSAIVA